jgi:hypothetical protein
MCCIRVKVNYDERQSHSPDTRSFTYDGAISARNSQIEAFLKDWEIFVDHHSKNSFLKKSLQNGQITVGVYSTMLPF